MKVKPADTERASAEFRRAFTENGFGLTLDALRDALGGGSLTDVKKLRVRLVEECQAANDISGILPDDIKTQIFNTLSSAYGELRRMALLELSEHRKRTEQRAAAADKEIDDLVLKLDRLEASAKEGATRYNRLLTDYEAVKAAEREQHATIAELKIENRMLKEQRVTLERLLPTPKPAPASSGKSASGSATATGKSKTPRRVANSRD